MAERFIAGILASFLFTFATAQSIVIDWVMKRLPWNKGSLLFLLEAMLYIVAGIIATMMLFLIVMHTFSMFLTFYVLGVAASLLYFVSLRFLRRKKKALHVA